MPKQHPPTNFASALLIIHPRDNVAVVLRNLCAGQPVTVSGRTITIADDIPCGHKLAITPIAAGEQVMKYGQPIGRATSNIAPGEWVHVHNVRTNLEGVQEYCYHPQLSPVEHIPDGLTFNAFVRPNGEVGIRNELWILPTVGCVNGVAESLARQFRDKTAGSVIDGVFAFTHPFGCSQLGDDHLNTQKILANLARHPNAAGVLVVGLGCENNTLDSFRKVLGDDDPDRYRFMVTQQVDDELAIGTHLLGELAERAGQFRRQSVPLAKLRVGLKCGGSDGLSGVTANPLVGVVCDQLVARDATAVLTEVPEMFGAEPLFMNRCVDREVFDQCAAMLNGFKQYFLRYGQPVYENPSAGNKDGGITTLEDKSLGCLQKGGATPVVDVLPYGGRLSRSGLNFITGPGNDPVSLTLLAASGAHLVLFTTGRGTPLGGPVPTLKISTNTPLAQRKRNWIDFDAGRLLEDAPMSQLADELLKQLIAVASGERTRNETNGFREIAIFKDGVTV
jgi:altronate hydrolase